MTTHATFPLSNTRFALQIKKGNTQYLLVISSDGEFAIHQG